MPEKPLVFISCGQCTPDEIALGNAVERFIRDKTLYEPYFAEQQNTLDGLVTNILSALRRASAFIGIMHHRGTISTPGGGIVTRGSVWVEQELAICAFAQHVLDRQLAVVIYLQRGISREGIRSQLLLKPVEFEDVSEVLADLPKQVAKWELQPFPTAPLIARWRWKLQPGYTGERHEYKLSVELYNNSNDLIDQWKFELWFPSSFIEHADQSQPFVYHSDSDTNHSGDDKRLWPGIGLPVIAVTYVVTNANWPGWLEAPSPTPKVRLRVLTANAKPWEEEIPLMEIQQF